MRQFLLIFIYLIIPYNFIFAQDDNDKEESVEMDKRLAITSGFLCGGGSLIGIDAEKLLTKHIGFQIGAGYKGFGAGINYHFKPVINKSFLSLQYWHQGAGETYVQSLIGPSINFRWKFLAAQLGYAYILDRGTKFNSVYPTYNPSFIFIYSAGIFFTLK